jgi:ribosomal protein S19E (S16A)
MLKSAKRLHGGTIFEIIFMIINNEVMKTFHIEVTNESEEELITKILENLQQKGMIKFSEEPGNQVNEKRSPASEEQVQEIIDEAELGPYYSEKEAKNILNL